MDETPHRAVDRIVSGVFNSIENLGRSGVNTLKSTGRDIITALDKPFKDLTGKEGPINMVGSVADGLVDAGANFVEKGVVGSAKIAKEGVMKAMDHPAEEIGFPPKLGGFKLFQKPK